MDQRDEVSDWFLELVMQVAALQPPPPVSCSPYYGVRQGCAVRRLSRMLEIESHASLPVKQKRINAHVLCSRSVDAAPLLVCDATVTCDLHVAKRHRR